MQKLVIAAILVTLLFPTDSFCQLVSPPRVEPDGPPLFVVTVNGKDGFIDSDGRMVIQPTFEKAYPFTDGLAAVQQEELWGFIDTRGQMVIEPRFIMVGLFSEGLASFRDKRFTDPWGYIDKSGMVVIEPQYDAAGDFRHGVARVGFATLRGKVLSRVADLGVECDYRFIDRTGTIVSEPPPLRFATGERGELIPFTKDGLTGYLNSEGNIAIQPQFQVASAFSEGLACVCQNELFGFIDTHGEWVIPPRFQYANDFSDGLAGVSLGENRWCFIDRNRLEAIPAKFSWVYGGFRHGLAEVAFDGKRGYINKKGEWVWKPSE